MQIFGGNRRCTMIFDMIWYLVLNWHLTAAEVCISRPEKVWFYPQNEAPPPPQCEKPPWESWNFVQIKSWGGGSKLPRTKKNLLQHSRLWRNYITMVAEPRKLFSGYRYKCHGWSANRCTGGGDGKEGFLEKVNTWRGIIKEEQLWKHLFPPWEAGIPTMLVPFETPRKTHVDMTRRRFTMPSGQKYGLKILPCKKMHAHLVNRLLLKDREGATG